MINQINSEYFKNYLDDNFNNLIDNNSICGIVYRATNIINGKVYIGITIKTLEDRISGHIKHTFKDKTKKFYFQRSILKHGIENFIWEVVDVFYSKEEGIDKEKEYIWLHNSFGTNGYNSCTGGQWGDTISNHPDKKRIVDQVSESLKRSEKNKGKNNHMYGRNDQCFGETGIVAFAKNNIGKTNKEIYGEEKALLMVEKAKETKKKNNKKIIRFKIIPSKEFLKFLIDYAYYDKTIYSIISLCKLFQIPSKGYTHGIIQKYLKILFKEEYSKINSDFRSRQVSGSKNPRYGAETKQSTRDKIGSKNKGRPSPFKKQIDLKLLIDIYFETKSDMNKMKNAFNCSDTLIRRHLRLVNLLSFRSKDRIKKEKFFSTYTKEEFLEKVLL